MPGGTIQRPVNAIFGYDKSTGLYVPILVDPPQQDPNNNNEYYALLPTRVTNLPPLGPQASNQSLSIVLSSDLVALPVSGTISVDTSLLATGAKQDTGNTSLTSILTQVTNHTETNSAAAKADLDLIAAQTTLTPNISDRWARQVGQVDLARWNGAAVDANRGIPVEKSAITYIRNAKAFRATTGAISETTAKTIPFSIFNPAASGKAILILSLTCWWGGGTNYAEIRWTTADPALATALTVANLQGNGAASSIVTSCTYTTASTPPAGTNLLGSLPTATNLPTDFFGKDTAYLLPNGTAWGIELFLNTTAASARYCITADYLEF